MKKNTLKKAMPAALALTLTLGALPLYAANTLEIPLTDGELPATDLFQQNGYAVFEKMEGTVTSIHTLEDGRTVLRVETAEGTEADFFIEDPSVIVNQQGLIGLSDLAEGAQVSIYYVTPLMMTMIYPAQYTANVIILKDDAESSSRAEVSLFDENLLNAEQDLYIHLSEDTRILDQRGEIYEGEVREKILIYFSDIMALSYPAQTTPDQIIVLDLSPSDLNPASGNPDAENEETAGTPEAEDILIMDKLEPSDFANMRIFVNGEYVEDAVFVNEEGQILFPLRAVAEALGYPVTWDNELQKVVIGVAITLTPGELEYHIGRMAPQYLDTVPLSIEGRIYVSGDFITTALQAQIDISQGIYRITDLQEMEQQ